MSPLSLLLNVLWIIFGGLWMAAGWLLAAVIMAITIVGLPWSRAALRIAVYTLSALWPHRGRSPQWRCRGDI
jgi:uncharacterized membrane protein YccF (DUF307 family)